jgi:cyclopropane fatty-acyl-phospholipid synthase-like methyltransferase
MPWYNENLDFDLEEEIIKRKITSGKFLYLGTGPGTQVVQLSRLGFYVTGSDLSEHAIENARKLSDKVNFIVDNILSSQIKGNEFYYIFDRGCFHVICANDRKRYVMRIKKILRDNSILSLKCFSDKELRQEGPHRFSENEIKEIFEKEGRFKIEDIKETVYQGTLNPLLKALFVVMMKRGNLKKLS